MFIVESAADPGARTGAAAARRVVIKVGTNVVMRDDGQLAVARLHALAESIAALRAAGRSVVLVSSGAIGLGAHRLGLAGRPAELRLKQACAAIGQGRLMRLYADAFDSLGVVCAQVLLTEDDFAVPARHANLHATLSALLELGVVPIINENDTVSTLELERPVDGAPPVFGDNDQLSALIATHVGADLLLLLSDVDGVYSAHPSEPGATLLATVGSETPDVHTAGPGRGRGGMASKLGAARVAASHGVATIIANGRTPGIIEAVCGGQSVGTLIVGGDGR